MRLRVTVKITALLLCMSVLGIYYAGFTVHAETTAAAEDITKQTLISSPGKGAPIKNMLDRNYITVWTSKSPDTFLQFDAGAGKSIGGLYIKWESVPDNLVFRESSDGANWTNIVPERTHKYLHEYISLPQAARYVQMKAADGALSINEVYALSPGTPPNWVQQWNPTCTKADILFIPTHQDDEDLWFGGALALYSVQEKKNCQVAYLIQNGIRRNHEALDSEWHVGIKNYPVFSSFRDVFSLTIEQAERDYDSSKIIQYQVGLLRRFKPDVVVDQDENGEYGHGAHKLNVKCLKSALRLSPDANYDPDTVKQYGVWDVPKTYLHIYPQEPIVLNYSAKLPEMGNKTPFQLAVEAFKLNVSQQNDKHAVLESGPFDCRKFGLFRTLVGFDQKKDDMFENIGNPTGPAQYADPKEVVPGTVSSPSSVPPSSSALPEASSQEASAQLPSSQPESSQAAVDLKPGDNQRIWIIPVFVLFLAIALSVVMTAKRAVRRRRSMERTIPHQVTYIDESGKTGQRDKIIASIDSDVQALMQDMSDDQPAMTENDPQEPGNPGTEDGQK